MKNTRLRKTMKACSIALLALTSCAAVAAENENENGLQVTKDFVPDECNVKTKPGNQLSMHYTGTIAQTSATGEPGKKFDSSLDHGSPFDFVLGQGQVIKGWDQGLVGMCVGEKRTLIIPPELGYGDHGAGSDIPGGATLHFTVECLSISEAPKEPNLFIEIDTDKSKDLTKEEIGAWFKDKRDSEMPPQLWENEDKNKDGVVSWAEFTGPKGSSVDDVE